MLESTGFKTSYSVFNLYFSCWLFLNASIRGKVAFLGAFVLVGLKWKCWMSVDSLGVWSRFSIVVDDDDDEQAEDVDDVGDEDLTTGGLVEVDILLPAFDECTVLRRFSTGKQVLFDRKLSSRDCSSCFLSLNNTIFFANYYAKFSKQSL